MPSFEDFSLDNELLEAIAKETYTKPTIIQQKAIPIIMSGQDLLGIAQTGTGKTAAFALPILNRLTKVPVDPEVYNRVKALVLVPTRELALQIGESFNTYGQFTTVKAGVIFGGVTPKRHIKVLKREPSILVATPGRLKSLAEDGYLDLGSIEVFVLDEADRMLEMGMVQDVKDVIAMLPKNRQTLMFSATMPSEVTSLVKSILHNPKKIEVAQEKKPNPQITQQVCYIEETHKAERLIELLCEHEFESVMIFVRTKKKADKIAKTINISNIRNIRTRAFHGDLSQNERMRVLDMFRRKEIQILVATDVAARGIDIEQLSAVVNFNIPNVPQTYIHRIGRTGRAGEKGFSISFCSKDEKAYLTAIENLQGKKLHLVK